jgi:hypothetical protein
MAEKTFFDEGGVTVTQTRITVGGDTYPLASVSSCRYRYSVETAPIKSFLKKAIMFVGIIIGIGIGVSRKNPRAGLSVAILAVIGAQFIKGKYKLYKLYLGSASGERAVLHDKDEHFMDQVSRAINEAIESRG